MTVYIVSELYDFEGAEVRAVCETYKEALSIAMELDESTHNDGVKIESASTTEPRTIELVQEWEA